MTDKLLASKEGGVGTVTFNNPAKHNAMSLEMWEATVHHLEEYAKDPDVRVVVLTGAGGKAFVSGADISKFENERSSKEGVERYNAAVERGYATVYNFPKPTIAMVRGYCIGGGPRPRGLRRHAHLLAELALRRAGRQAWAWL